MKGKFLLSVVALLLPLSVAGQVARPTGSDAAVNFDRYEVYGAAAYSSANQVKGSSALLGGNVGADLKLKRWFGAAVDFGYYGAEASSNSHVSTSMSTFLAGPEVYIPADNLTGFFHVLFGGAHTGGVGAKPDISFATGIGGGFEYAVSKRLAIRISGDGILSSFVEDPDNVGYSAHLRVNPRATGGVAYRF